MQTCRACGESKPLSAFQYRKDSDKYRTECKSCQSDINKSYKQKRKEVGMPLLQAKKLHIPDNHHECYKCGSVMPIDKFKKDNRSKDGYSNLCLECKRKEITKMTPEQRIHKNQKQSDRYYSNEDIRQKKAEYNARRYQEKKDCILERNKQWRQTPNGKDSIARQNHKRRDMRQEKLPYGSLKKILAEANNTCFYCNEDLDNGHHFDHYIPLSRGGTNDIGNLVVSCPTCNLSKFTKMPDEFFRQIYGVTNDTSRF